MSKVIEGSWSGGPVTVPDVRDIEDAVTRLEGVISATPLQYSERLSRAVRARVYLKREDLQGVRSYKIRGAYNVIAQLNAAERAAGVVAASAGNHAQGVAWACRTLGVRGRIFVPSKTPRQKRDRIRFHGGDAVELIVTGATYDDSAAAAAEDAQRTGATMVEPFDDARTMAGQGTVAREILAQLRELGEEPPAHLVVPVGGAGLLGGIATYLAEHSTETELVGVEPAGAASLAAALDTGGPVTLGAIDPFVDGAAVKRVGAAPYAVADAYRDRITMTSVSEGAVCTELLDLYQNEGIIAEPAGALSVAAVHDLRPVPESTVVCIVSGGNNDVSRYDEIIERSLVHQGLKHYFLVNFAQKPGQLRSFLDRVLGPEDDITHFEYTKRNNRDTGTALVGLELGSPTGLHPLLARIEDEGFDTRRLLPGTPEYDYLT